VIRRCSVLVLSAALLLGACGGGDGKQVAAFCNQLKEFRAKYVNVAGNLTKAQVDAASKDFEGIAKNAPSSIRASAQSVSDAFDLYAQGTPAPAYRTDEIKTASDNLNKFGTTKCGIDLSPPTT